MNDIESALNNFANAKSRLTHALETTPDDRINWSPSPTSRTPIQLVAHAAGAIKNLHGMMDNRPFPVPDRVSADREFRAWEQQFTTREGVLAVLNEASSSYESWLKNLPEDKLDELVSLPFDLGQAPLRMVMTFPAMHTESHVYQIDYVQTIYGDHDWH